MKQFVMNISIHVEANSPEEAFEVLMNEKSLEAIVLAIKANKENIKEVYNHQSDETIIN